VRVPLFDSTVHNRHAGFVVPAPCSVLARRAHSRWPRSLPAETQTASGSATPDRAPHGTHRESASETITGVETLSRRVLCLEVPKKVLQGAVEGLQHVPSLGGEHLLELLQHGASSRGRRGCAAAALHHLSQPPASRGPECSGVIYYQPASAVSPPIQQLRCISRRLDQRYHRCAALTQEPIAPAEIWSFFSHARPM